MQGTFFYLYPIFVLQIAIMKKILILAIVALSCNAASAQYTKKPVKKEEQKQTKTKGFYGSMGVGYALPTASQSLSTDGIPFNGLAGSANGSSFNTFNYKKASFTSGVQVRLNAGYGFNKNLAAELGVNIGIATKTYESNITFPSQDGLTQYRQKRKMHAQSPAFLLPSVVLQTSGAKMNVYSKAGLALPVGGKIHTEIEQASNLTNTTDYEMINSSYEMKTKFNIGFSGALGMKYNIDKGISLWLEACLLSYTAYAKEEVLTDLTVDGINVTNQVRNKTTSYKMKSGNSADPAYALPMSSLGINAGATLAFYKL